MASRMLPSMCHHFHPGLRKFREDRTEAAQLQLGVYFINMTLFVDINYSILSQNTQSLDAPETANHNVTSHSCPNDGSHIRDGFHVEPTLPSNIQRSLISRYFSIANIEVIIKYLYFKC